MLGRERLVELFEQLGGAADAEALLERVSRLAALTPDDMAVCILRAGDAAPADGPRLEELEVTQAEVGESLEHFLRVCGVPLSEVPGVLREAGEAARHEGSATVQVRLGDFRPGVDVVPANVVRLDDRRVGAGT